MEFCEEGKERINIAKNISDKLNTMTRHDWTAWNVFTFKKDKKNPDPKRFRVFSTMHVKGFGAKPVKHVMDIYFNEVSKTVDIVLKIDIKINSDDVNEENPMDNCLSDKYKEENWTIVFSKKQSVLSKLSRR